MSKIKPEWTVWWFETDKFNGKQTRVYWDFELVDDASNLVMDKAEEGIRATMERIANCHWHHVHAWSEGQS